MWGQENPVKQAGVPKQADRPIKPIPPEALEAMLRAAAKGRNPWRDRALILLLVDTGLRVCEALSIRLEDVNTETRCVWVRGKGDKDRPAFYSYRVARFLNAYIAKERGAQPGVGYLFTTDEGEPFSRLRVRDMLRRVARRAGLDPAKVNVHPHAFRHTFAVRYLLHGGAALSLRRRLGHSTMEMVAHERQPGARRAAALPQRAGRPLGAPLVHRGCQEGRLASYFGDAVMSVNLNGVWGWRGKNGQGGKTSLPDFEEIAFNGREVVLAFDSDVVRKEQVKLALERLAAFLASRGAHARVLYLPEPGGRKLGVDDALAAGYNPLEYLQTPQGHEARGLLGTHPLTGQKLFLPEGYSLEQGGLYRMVGDKPRPVYPGHLAVNALGSELDTGDETLTVVFDRGLNSRTTVTAPRAELAKAKGVLEYLAARGAAVSEVNAKEVAAYLVAFAHHNRTALPHESRISRLGLYRRGSTLVLPDGAVGDIHTAVKPEPAVRVGKNLGAYRRVLEEASGWEDAGVFWAALSLALAAPAIVRAGVRRNPVLYLVGDSGTGKSTLAQFAVGVWGDPTHSPLRLEAGRTTLAGYLQTLERLGSLPLFIDEAHTAREQDNPLEKLVYQFANDESYTRGGADGSTAVGLLSCPILIPFATCRCSGRGSSTVPPA